MGLPAATMKRYLWVADPSLRVSCPLATLVRPCTSRQVTFSRLPKKKLPKRRAPRMARSSRYASCFARGPARTSVCGRSRFPSSPLTPRIRGFGARRCPDAASLPAPLSGRSPTITVRNGIGQRSEATLAPERAAQRGEPQGWGEQNAAVAALGHPWPVRHSCILHVTKAHHAGSSKSLTPLCPSELVTVGYL